MRSLEVTLPTLIALVRSLRRSRLFDSKWAALAVAGLGTLNATLDNGILTVATPELARAFNVPVSVAVWVAVAYLLVSLGLLLTVGWTGDVLGRRTVWATGVAVFAAGLGLAWLAPNIYVLIATRVLQACGAAMILSQGYAIITDAFPPSERGRGLGIHGAIAGVGLGVGPFLGGVLLDTLGWPSVFYARIPVALLSLALGLLVLRNERLPGKPKVDVAGAIGLFVLLGGLLFAINRAGAWGITHPVTLASLGVAALTAPFLVWVERHGVRPVLDMALLRLRQYRLSMVAIVFHYLSQGAMMLVAAFYLLNARGFSQIAAGALLATYQLARLPVSPLAGVLSDKLGARLLMTVGNAIACAGLLLLPLFSLSTPVALMIASFMFLGIASAAFEPPVTSAVMGSVPRDRLGTAAASVSTARQIGISGGLALAGAVYEARSAAHESALLAAGLPAHEAAAKAVTFGFHDAALVCAAMALIAALVSAVPHTSKSKAP